MCKAARVRCEEDEMITVAAVEVLWLDNRGCSIAEEAQRGMHARPVV